MWGERIRSMSHRGQNHCWKPHPSEWNGQALRMSSLSCTCDTAEKQARSLRERAGKANQSRWTGNWLPVASCPENTVYMFKDFVIVTVLCSTNKAIFYLVAWQLQTPLMDAYFQHSLPTCFHGGNRLTVALRQQVKWDADKSFIPE